MQDILRTQAEIIDRGRQVDFSLEKLVYPLGIPVIFSAEPYSLTFHELALGANDLWSLVQDATVADEYEYLRALVVKSLGKPMIAFCTGFDESIPNALVASIFNLTGPDSIVTVFARGENHQLENNHLPAGGLGLSRLLRGNPSRERVEISSSRAAFIIDTKRLHPVKSTLILRGVVDG